MKNGKPFTMRMENGQIMNSTLWTQAVYIFVIKSIMHFPAFADKIVLAFCHFVSAACTVEFVKLIYHHLCHRIRMLCNPGMCFRITANNTPASELWAHLNPDTCGSNNLCVTKTNAYLNVVLKYSAGKIVKSSKMTLKIKNIASAERTLSHVRHSLLRFSF